MQGNLGAGNYSGDNELGARPVHSRTQDTRYFRMMETYYMVKALVGQALSKTKHNHGELLSAIHILDGKFELYCRSENGIKFHVTQILK
jgi:hypothetical protein